ncbi:MAG: isochorismatase family protein [Ignavibacteria bacterium]
MNIGFLIVDMQKIFLDELREKINVQRAVEHINYVSEMLRSKGHCIVHIQDIESENENNSDQIDFIPEIVIAETDLRLRKIKSNSFMDTELEKILKDKNIELIIVSGFSAEQCVLFTYNGALEREFNSVILQNGILSANISAVSETQRDRNLISYPVVEFLTRSV